MAAVLLEGTMTVIDAFKSVCLPCILDTISMLFDIQLGAMSYIQLLTYTHRRYDMTR